MLLRSSRNCFSAVKSYSSFRATVKFSTDKKNTESYSEKMEKTGRPLSPHVQEYAFPIAAISSVMVRGTGMALTVGCAGIGGLSLVGCDVPALMSMLGTSSAGPLFKFAVAFPLLYHYGGAIRHVAWDLTPELLENEGVEVASKALIGVSIAGATVAAFI